MLKLLADENISKSTLTFLGSLNFNVRSVSEYEMEGCADTDILRRAALESRIVLTQDIDFGNLVRYPVYYTGVILLRLKDQTPKKVNLVLKKFFEKVNLKLLNKSLTIVTEEKYRIRSFR